MSWWPSAGCRPVKNSALIWPKTLAEPMSSPTGVIRTLLSSPHASMPPTKPSTVLSCMMGSGWKPSRLTLTMPCDAPSTLSMPSGDAYCKPSWPAVWPWFCMPITVVDSESRTEQLMVNMRVGVTVSARQHGHGRRCKVR